MVLGCEQIVKGVELYQDSQTSKMEFADEILKIRKKFSFTYYVVLLFWSSQAKYSKLKFWILRLTFSKFGGKILGIRKNLYFYFSLFLESTD